MMHTHCTFYKSSNVISKTEQKMVNLTLLMKLKGNFCLFFFLKREPYTRVNLKNTNLESEVDKKPF